GPGRRAAPREGRGRLGASLRARRRRVEAREPARREGARARRGRALRAGANGGPARGPGGGRPPAAGRRAPVRDRQRQPRRRLPLRRPLRPRGAAGRARGAARGRGARALPGHGRPGLRRRRRRREAPGGERVIVAVGLDLIEIRRMRRAAERHPERFIARCFHPEELAELAGRADVYPGLAVRFAAKEAFAKVWPPSLGGRAARVVKAGPRPERRGSPAVARAVRAEGLVAGVSLPHAGARAAAVVVLERRDPPERVEEGRT